MKDQKPPLRDRLALVFLSFFGTGYAPKAPGTVGSLATIPLIILLSYLDLNIFFLIGFTVALTILSSLVAEYIQSKFQVHDPGWIVIDEVIGMLVTWIFIFPSTEPIDLILLFVLFRIFDIIKIFPASWFDKNLKHGAGTIIDDVISGLYAGILLWGLKYFHLIS